MRLHAVTVVCGFTLKFTNVWKMIFFFSLRISYFPECVAFFFYISLS